MTKILVIDDDEAINELISVNLELAGYKVLKALNGSRGYALAKQELPDVVVLDVMMPEVDGYTVAKRIRENLETKDIPIIMLTALNMLQNKVQGFNIGVDDYLVKPFEMEELLVRIKALLKRTNHIPKSVAQKEVLTQGDITLIPETYSVEIKGQVAKVTPIEFDIINLLMQNYGNMVSSAKILNDVWGYEADDAVETIRVHMRHIRTKLDKISDGKKYIETIYGGGYRLLPEGVLDKSSK
ncbi:response regulator transcription factor [bacterium]|nr:response regulator transcription factor [bacterium]